MDAIEITHALAKLENISKVLSGEITEEQGFCPRPYQTPIIMKGPDPESSFKK